MMSMIDNSKPNEIVLNLQFNEAHGLERDTKKIWNTSRLMYLFERKNLSWMQSVLQGGRGRVRLTIDNFFLPDLAYLLDVLSKQYPRNTFYKKLYQELHDKTWLKNTLLTHKPIIDKSKLADITKDFKPEPYQTEFVELYNDKKQKYNLNGYVLAFQQGLGKTFTSLLLMHLLGKNKIVIIAPKSTLRTVWANEIQNVFIDKQSIWVVGDPVSNARFSILNYESMDKFDQIKDTFLPTDNIGIIIDESHNFRNSDAKRVQELKNIAEFTKCKDILFMSGTPIKGAGNEMIPMMDILDNYYTDEVGEVFKKVFGSNKAVALDIINNRLGLFMHRKLKKDVLKGLPEKFEHTLTVKTPNGHKYTANNVQKIIEIFVKERETYYKKNNDYYHDLYYGALKQFEAKAHFDKISYSKYREGVAYFNKNGYSSMSEHDRELAKELNIFEKTYILPQLSQPFKDNFKKSKSVIKYVSLKILGEVLGGLLSRLRVEMISEMLQHAKIEEYIDQAVKKTILFTSYVDVLKTAEHYLHTKHKYKVLTVYGENTKDIVVTLAKFKENELFNPLIATTPTLSTGVTLIVANRVFFIDKPWRWSDYEQGSDRVYRIGQDEDVDIFSLILDTGKEPNLSTRMAEIVKWSETMFTGIVGDSIPVTEDYGLYEEPEALSFELEDNELMDCQQDISYVMALEDHGYDEVSSFHKMFMKG